MERKCRVMALVIGKIGHMGYEVFAGGVNGGRGEGGAVVLVKG